MSKERDYHGDGSYTDRYSDGQSVTYNSDGSVREHSQTVTSYPLTGLGGNRQVTHDGEGNLINAQTRHD